MAFQYFAEEEVEIGVIEVGMGGRFDATNVCHPLGTIITNVSFDHERYLGSSLPDIAFEKAGIIKRRVPVVVGPVERDVLRRVTGTGAPPERPADGVRQGISLCRS